MGENKRTLIMEEVDVYGKGKEREGKNTLNRRRKRRGR